MSSIKEQVIKNRLAVSIIRLKLSVSPITKGTELLPKKTNCLI